MEREKESSPGILADRLRLIGEEIVPQEAFKDLNSGEFWIFLEEPDPDKWPPQMEHLKQYLEQEE